MQNEKILTDEEVNEIVDKIMMKNKLVERLFIKKRRIMKELKVLTSNMQCRAGYNIGKETIIQNEQVNMIIETNSDIIILTEIAKINSSYDNRKLDKTKNANGLEYLKEQLSKNNYLFYSEFCKGKNSVLIAIKKDIIEENTEKETSYNFEDVNLCKLRLKLKSGEVLTVIGLRMEVETRKGESSKEPSYEIRWKIFEEKVLPEIEKIKKDDFCIIGGDFNNARCLGNLDLPFNEEDYEGYNQKSYNLNKIKGILSEYEFEMIDNNNGSPLLTHRIGKHSYPNDHIFTKRFKKKSVCILLSLIHI